MKTAVTELGDSRVRVDVGIEPDTIEKRVERAARQLAGDMRVPGFRKGKVPADLVIQRVGREAVLEQALRDSLAEWYERALLETGITPIGDPQLNVESLPGAGEELEFSIEVAVRPPAKLGEYKGLEVGKVEPEVSDDHRPENLAGKHAVFKLTVKEVREKQLPELDDDFAAEASEFETLEELRDAIRSQLSEGLEQRAEAEFREAAVDAVAANAKIEIPHELVHARAHEMWERIERQLTARGIDPQAYAQMQGKDRHDLINDAEEDAERALRREAVLAAVADAEAIEPTDEDLIEAIGPGEGKNAPEKLLARLRETGRDALLRDDVRMRKAAEVIAESAKPIPMDRATAREQIWTPEKGEGETARAEEPAAQKPGELWTPGS